MVLRPLTFDDPELIAGIRACPPTKRESLVLDAAWLPGLRGGKYTPAIKDGKLTVAVPESASQQVIDEFRERLYGNFLASV